MNAPAPTGTIHSRNCQMNSKHSSRKQFSLKNGSILPRRITKYLWQWSVQIHGIIDQEHDEDFYLGMLIIILKECKVSISASSLKNAPIF